MLKKFYYVHNRGQGNPTFRHATIEDAIEEAIRLSKLTKKNFYVLKPVAHITEKGRIITVEEENNYNKIENCIFIEKTREPNKSATKWYASYIDFLCYLAKSVKKCLIYLVKNVIYEKIGLKYIVNLIVK